MSRSFHIAVVIRSALQWPDHELARAFRDVESGLPVPATEAREILIKALRDGHDVLPPCANHDARGNCLGHEKEASGG